MLPYFAFKASLEDFRHILEIRMKKNIGRTVLKTGTVVLRIMKDRENKQKVKSWGLRGQAWAQWKGPSAECCILVCCISTQWLYADHISRWEAVAPWKKSHVANVSHNFLQFVNSVSSTVLHHSSHWYIYKLLAFSHALSALTVHFSKHILNTCYLGRVLVVLSTQVFCLLLTFNRFYYFREFYVHRKIYYSFVKA